MRYSLPPDTVVFTGRAGEVEFITGAVATAATRGGVLSCAIDGMPGLGKTALAIHVAHLLRLQFADRCGCPQPARRPGGAAAHEMFLRMDAAETPGVAAELAAAAGGGLG